MPDHFMELFYPESIAIVGASEEPESVGLGLCTNLKSYSKPVYYVNPNHPTILGQATYGSLAKINKPVDLVLIAVPSQFVPAVIDEAGAMGSRSAVIVTAGFKESSVEGAKLEEIIGTSCKKFGLTMIGPNCLGIINPEVNLNASFAESMPPAGPIAFISQSGALCTSVIDYSKDLTLGFSKFVSMGNKANVDEIVLLRYLANDPQTKAIFLYVEDIRNAAGFIQTAYNITHGPNPKPIVMLKGGRTEAGAKASVSHTGALGGNDLYYHGLARQAGIIRVHSIAEMFNLALVVAHNPIPHGNRVAVVTNAGGPGILMTDEAVANGLTIASLSPDTLTSLSQILPSYTHVGNPVDILGDAKAEQYEKALATIAKDAAVDSTLILLTPQAGTEITETAKVIVASQSDKPKVASFMGKDIVLPGINVLRKNGVAVTEYPEDAARALAQFSNFGRDSLRVYEPFSLTEADDSRVKQLLDSVPKEQKLLPEREASIILSTFGFSMLKTIAAGSAEETRLAVGKIGVPCAIKINSPDITHKTDVGGVLLNVTIDQAAAAYESVITSVKAKDPNANIIGVTVVEMAPSGGTELILGLTRKPNFGTVLMVGMGGTYVEVEKDVSFGIMPLTRTDAIRMMQELRFAPVFTGYRGSQPLDIDVVIDCLGRLSLMAATVSEISELDINPLMLYPKGQGAKVVDVRIVRS
jgi:acetyltransferase